ncbi:MAG: hypothetical protein U5R46_06855 [Gammaproteobacteria bacterium]|nr:hypothetical protein [Gammaproteobacteria bacterium]
MLTKILVTVLVVIAVLTFYRVKNSGRVTDAARRLEARTPADKRFGRMVAYGFVGLLILISAVWYGLHWKEQHRIITIRVISDSQTTTYKAYNKDLKGNRFESIDGRTVILGDSERIEIISTE